MNELRKDYVLDRWVIIAKDRGKRPHDFTQKKEPQKKEICVFCPGNEALTPAEISRVEKNGKWIVRIIPNKYSATSLEYGLLDYGFESKPAYGRHELVIETNRHDKNLEDLSVDVIVKILKIYSERIEKLMKLPRTKYVLVFKNKGVDAGVSLAHSHTQIISLPSVPTLIADEARAARIYRQKNKKCVLCDVLKKELKTERKIFEDRNIAVIAPFASRFPFEAWIVPKKHIRFLKELNESELSSFALSLKKTINALNKILGKPSYNFYLHTSPQNADLHLHLELCPRVAIFGGFELGSGIIINTMPPEIAAKEYRKRL